MEVMIETDMQDDEEVTPQILVAVTQIFPPDVPEVAMMAVLPCPEVMVHPDGTVHI